MLRHLVRQRRLPPGTPAANAAARHFFWGKDPKDKNVTIIENKGGDDEAAAGSSSTSRSSSSSSSIVAPFGDNSPRPSSCLILPISRRPLFPGYMTAVLLKDEAAIEAIMKQHQTNSGANFVGMFLRKDDLSSSPSPSSEDGGDGEGEPVITDAGQQLYATGTFAQVHNIIRLEKKSQAQLLIMGHRRINLSSISSYGPPLVGIVEHWPRLSITGGEDDGSVSVIKAYSNELIAVARELIKVNPLAQEHMAQWVQRIELSDPFKLADFAAAMTTADAVELQRVLEEPRAEKRLELALHLLVKEREISKLQQQISKQVEEKMSKQQREYFLREQLKSIKAELGLEKDDKDELLSKYTGMLASLKEALSPPISPQVLKVIEDEAKRLSQLERNSPEFNVTRAYLDWLTSMPWGTTTKDLLELTIAKHVLDEDHFGLEDVKKRILEFIAVGKLRGSVNGKIICLLGPPGVGKTSIAASIAKALNRSFYRFSVGGLSDMAEIKGHRRTYIGAMPGKPIQCFKSTQCLNPLILIDEIDKITRGGWQGDPSSALLELLDPNQNASFVDHYLDVPVDFSQVLFVCTANDESTIPGPLRDRMEIIRISGYDSSEKMAIATKYLVPKALKEAGLDNTDEYRVDISQTALQLLVQNYCRESGVRSLEKAIEKLVRKIAFKFVEGAEKEAATGEASTPHQKKEMEVTGENVEEFLGKPRFSQETIYETSGKPLPVGVVMGLAWNPLGGSPIYIETVATPMSDGGGGGGGGGASNVSVITGQLGSVMKESVNIAYTYARSFVTKRDGGGSSSKGALFFKQHQIHLHVPEGAVEKDGPSAGVAMTTSLVSIATNTPLRPRLAMTGELSLTGKVLAVGGIKEKVLAARRSGADTVILPFANKADYEELPQFVKSEITVHFVKTFEEAFNIAFSAT